MAEPMHASLLEPFRPLKDPRLERPKQPNLLDSLVIACCPRLTGGAGFQEMARCGQSKRAWLHTCLALPQGLPSHDTLGRVCARLHPPRLQACLLASPQAVAPLPPGALVSLAGQTVNASWDRAPASSPWPMLAAWCAAPGGRVGGHIKPDQQSNALTALPARLQL